MIHIYTNDDSWKQLQENYKSNSGIVDSVQDKEEFIALCESVDFEKLLRNTSDYLGKNIKIEGELTCKR